MYQADSPTTMYEDYLISHDLFHWQSQSNTSEQSPTGQRYIRHRDLGYMPGTKRSSRYGAVAKFEGHRNRDSQQHPRWERLQ